MTPRPLYQTIAGIIDAYHRCKAIGNPFADTHLETINQIERDALPRGSGIDSGTTIDVDASTGDRLVLVTSFHHMNDGGMYDGWTDHKITVRPSLVHGITLTIGGRNRNGIKEYLYETFDHALSEVR